MERGGKRKGGGGGGGVWKMLLNSASPVASHTAAVSIERTVARLKNERSNHSRAL